MNGIYDISPDVRRHLQEQQVADLNELLGKYATHTGMFYAQGMGFGKTRVMCALVLTLMEHIPDFNAILVVKKSTFTQWQAEFNTLGLTVRSKEKITRNNTLSLAYEFNGIYKGAKCYVLITNYESRIDLASSYTIGLFDEGDTLKGGKCTRQRFEKIKFGFKVIATGTPYNNNPLEYAKLVGFLGTPFSFRSRNVDAFDRMDQLVQFATENTRRSNPAHTLPRVTIYLVKCRMDEKQRVAYDAVVDWYEKVKSFRKGDLNVFDQEHDFIDMDELGRKSPALKVKAFQLCLMRAEACVLNSPFLKEGSFRKISLPTLSFKNYSKISIIQNMTEHLLSQGSVSNSKIIIFGSSVHFLNDMAKALREVSIPTKMVSGKTLDRENILDSFKTDDRIRVLLLSTKVGSTGLNLEIANYVILPFPEHNPSVDLQSGSRVYRRTQENPIVIYRLYFERSVEEDIINLQDRKIKIGSCFVRYPTKADKLLDGVWDTADFRDISDPPSELTSSYVQSVKINELIINLQS